LLFCFLANRTQLKVYTVVACVSGSLDLYNQPSLGRFDVFVFAQ
jgi:hypothetical protein